MPTRRRRRAAPARPARRRPAGRERDRDRTLALLVQAGRDLFVKEGFERTTTRAISARAGVATGTFFLHFREKRDLLFHLFRDEVSAVVEESFAAAPPAGAQLAERLLGVFGRLYAYYARDLRLARTFLKELMFLAPGEHDEMMAMTLAFVGRLAAAIEAARDRGEVDRAVDPSLAAQQAFAAYLFVLVALLKGVAPLDVARAQLAAHLGLLVRGLAPGSSA
ncbi:MAG TPA: helix-turn-helix domain-containing protein [Anaeromyxobacteraceae bacterium]|nr:helix-turn-helix domain-containing protein [Anaeromyxobacteraceae bacterium]